MDPGKVELDAREQVVWKDEMHGEFVVMATRIDKTSGQRSGRCLMAIWLTKMYKYGLRPNSWLSGRSLDFVPYVPTQYTDCLICNLPRSSRDLSISGL